MDSTGRRRNTVARRHNSHSVHGNAVNRRQVWTAEHRIIAVETVAVSMRLEDVQPTAPSASSVAALDTGRSCVDQVEILIFHLRQVTDQTCIENRDTRLIRQAASNVVNNYHSLASVILFLFVRIICQPKL